MAGAGLLIVKYWRDIPTWSRLVVLFGVSSLLWGVGAAAQPRADPALGRLRGSLWFLSCGALALFAALLAGNVFGLDGAGVALVAGLVAAAEAGALWRLQEGSFQHLACLGGLITAVVGFAAALDGEALAGILLWVLGVVWALLGSRGSVRSPALATVLGAATLLVGAGVTAGPWADAAPVIGLVSALGLLGVGIATRHFALTGPGAAGVLVYLPWTVARLFRHALDAPLVVLISGALLLGVMVLLLRSRALLAIRGDA
jgi:hypothetical protein